MAEAKEPTKSMGPCNLVTHVIFQPRSPKKIKAKEALPWVNAALVATFPCLVLFMGWIGSTQK